MGLSQRDREILTFERQWWQYPGAKEAAVRDSFDVTMTRYYQEVNRIIELPAAMAFDPFTVKRLQRIRGQRSRSRSA